MTPVSLLVIDDNPLNLKLTRLVLEQHGFAVQTAGHAKEALAMLHTSPPALILLDLQLPDMDGFELVSVIKADPATRHIPVIALTAYAMKGDDRRALDAGCDDYIAKPIDTRTLADRVAQCLAQAARRRRS